MQTVILEINDEVKDTILSFLRILPSNAIKIIEDHDVLFTVKDESDYEMAIAEKNAGKSISLESLKKTHGL